MRKEKRQKEAKEIEHLHHWLHTVMVRSGRNPKQGTDGYPNRLDLVFKKYNKYRTEELGLTEITLPQMRRFFKELNYKTTFITTAKYERITVVMLRGYMIPPAITFGMHRKKKKRDHFKEVEEWQVKTDSPTLSGSWDMLHQIVNQYIKP